MILVNWQPDEKRFVAYSRERMSKAAYLKMLKTKKRPPEVEALIEALDRMWKNLDVHCAQCFAGKLEPAYRGCCSTCPNLGETKCIAKPIGCALYTCGTKQFNGMADPREPGFRSEVLGRIRMLTRFAQHHGLWTIYAEGYLRECEQEWTPEMLKAVQTLTTLAELV